MATKTSSNGAAGLERALVAASGQGLAEQSLDFDVVYARYAPYVAAIGVRLLGRPDLVDDLVQDVFLDAYRGLDKLKNPAAVKSWLATIAVRKARWELRRRSVRRFLGADDTPEYENLVANTASPEQRALLEQVFVILESVATEDRLAWTLRYLQGEKLADVATLCECSLATAKRRIAKAQAKIDKVMSDE